jgi:RNA polymerase sigma factor (sigma-70 family)
MGKRLCDLTPEELMTLHVILVRMVSRIVGDNGTAEEVVQDAFCKASTKGELKSIGGWLYVTARRGGQNVVRQWIRREPHDRQLSVRKASEARNAFRETELKKELREDIADALAHLPDDERVVIELWMAGDNQRQIAKAKDLSARRVSKVLHAAMDDLRRILDRPQ